jgi:Ca2+-binding RTX toxin-like protein
MGLFKLKRLGLFAGIITALTGVGFAATTVFAGGSIAPFICITSPEDGFTTSPGLLQVEVKFRASANHYKYQPTGNVKLIILKINGEEVARVENPPQEKEGTHVFEVDTSSYPDGEITLQALAFQGSEGAMHVGKSAYVTVVLESAEPEITADTDPDPNAAGWNNSDVTVSFSTNVPPAKIASLTSPIVVTTEGANQEVHGTVLDIYGNTASTSAFVSLDKTPPAVDIVLPGDGVPVVIPEVTVTGTVSDALSGLNSVTCNGILATVSDSTFVCGVPVIVGPNSITVHAEDMAGNSSQDSITVNGIADVNDEPELRCHGFVPTLIGSNGDDLIVGTDGSDVIVGLDGNDVLIGMGGQDFICGGPGDDLISGGRGHDRLHGEAGNDAISGQNGNDELVGDGGDDLLAGGVGNDDIMCGPELDTADGTSGADLVTADCENVLDSTSSESLIDDDLLCTSATATLTGTDDDDVLIGTPGADVILGLGGDDVLVGLDERDRLCGGEGDDVLSGGLERDHLNGGPGHDMIAGGQGQDHLLGERGNDLLNGDGDDDHIKCGNGSDFANGWIGVDTTDGTCELTAGIP